MILDPPPSESPQATVTTHSSSKVSPESWTLPESLPHSAVDLS